MTMTISDKEHATHVWVTYAKISDKEKGNVDMSTQEQELFIIDKDNTAYLHDNDWAIVLKQYVIKQSKYKIVTIEMVKP